MCFFHFAGTTGGYQKYMKWWGNNKEDLQNLLDWYMDKRKKGDDNPLFKRVSPYEQYDNGKPINFLHGLIYRESKELQDAYPNPFMTGGNKSFYDHVTQMHLPNFTRVDILFGDCAKVTSHAKSIHNFRSNVRDLRRTLDEMRKVIDTLHS